MSEEFEKFWEESRGDFLHAMPEQASKERAWRVWTAAWDSRGKLDAEIAGQNKHRRCMELGRNLTQESIIDAIREGGETKLAALKEGLSIKGAKQFIEEVKP